MPTNSPQPPQGGAPGGVSPTQSALRGRSPPRSESGAPPAAAESPEALSIELPAGRRGGCVEPIAAPPGLVGARPRAQGSPLPGGGGGRRLLPAMADDRRAQVASADRARAGRRHSHSPIPSAPRPQDPARPGTAAAPPDIPPPPALGRRHPTCPAGSPGDSPGGPPLQPALGPTLRPARRGSPAQARAEGAAPGAADGSPQRTAAEASPPSGSPARADGGAIPPSGDAQGPAAPRLVQSRLLRRMSGPRSPPDSPPALPPDQQPRPRSPERLAGGSVAASTWLLAALQPAAGEATYSLQRWNRTLWVPVEAALSPGCIELREPGGGPARSFPFSALTISPGAPSGDRSGMPSVALAAAGESAVLAAAGSALPQFVLAAAAAQAAWLRAAASARSAVAAAAKKRLVIVHYNDVYHLDPRPAEPCGGAARFHRRLEEIRARCNPLVLFSGDFVGPSLMSVIMRGKQIVDGMDAIGTHFGCFGNHEFDFGLRNLERIIGGHSQGDHVFAGSRIGWVATNLLSKGEPICGAMRDKIVVWEGVRVGVLGLAEDWLRGCPKLQPGEVEYADVFQEGETRAQGLKRRGAEFVVALTHCRLATDRSLTACCPSIDLLLGGHDHFYHLELDARIVKSGEEFQWLSEVTVTVDPAAERETRPTVECRTHAITQDIAESPRLLALERRYNDRMVDKLGGVLCSTDSPLDSTEAACRFMEGQLTNLCADVMADRSGADCAVLGGAAVSGKQVLPPGPVTVGDVFTWFPFETKVQTVELRGADLLELLSASVRELPGEAPSFPHPSASLQFVIDMKQTPPVVTSATLRGEPVLRSQLLTVAVTDFVAAGKERFKFITQRCRVVTEEETAEQMGQWMLDHLAPRGNPAHAALFSDSDSEGSGWYEEGEEFEEEREDTAEADPTRDPMGAAPGAAASVPLASPIPAGQDLTESAAATSTTNEQHRQSTADGAFFSSVDLARESRTERPSRGARSRSRSRGRQSRGGSMATLTPVAESSDAQVDTALLQCAPEALARFCVALSHAAVADAGVDSLRAAAEACRQLLSNVDAIAVWISHRGPGGPFSLAARDPPEAGATPRSEKSGVEQRCPQAVCDCAAAQRPVRGSEQLCVPSAPQGRAVAVAQLFYAPGRSGSTPLQSPSEPDCGASVSDMWAVSSRPAPAALGALARVACAQQRAARTKEDARHRGDAVASLLDVGAQLAAAPPTEPREHAALLSGVGERLLRCGLCLLFLVDVSSNDEGGELWAAYSPAVGGSREGRRGTLLTLRSPLGSGLIGGVVNSGVGVMREAAAAGEDAQLPCASLRFATFSLLCVPLTAPSQGGASSVLGALYCARDECEGAFGQRDEALAKSFASYAGALLASTQELGRLRQGHGAEELPQLVLPPLGRITVLEPAVSPELFAVPAPFPVPATAVLPPPAAPRPPSGASPRRVSIAPAPSDPDVSPQQLRVPEPEWLQRAQRRRSTQTGVLPQSVAGRRGENVSALSLADTARTASGNSLKRTGSALAVRRVSAAAADGRRVSAAHRGAGDPACGGPSPTATSPGVAIMCIGPTGSPGQVVSPGLGKIRSGGFLHSPAFRPPEALSRGSSGKLSARRRGAAAGGEATVTFKMQPQ
eukprot:TRINITY_DN2034_c0_g1_i2.p1 TRINITY_DN2034_c0_g1~~TRINITY_DN2034_c0_g1_i2.p1  ORF type:complete len:1621 (+),score=348.39 TRINITY_DN2034_c0_g1_i2:99-4961(+)